MNRFIARTAALAIVSSALGGCALAPTDASDADDALARTTEEALVLTAKPPPPPRYLVRSARSACEAIPGTAWSVEPVDSPIGEDFCRYTWHGSVAPDLETLYPHARLDDVSHAPYVVRERGSAPPATWPVATLAKESSRPVLAGPARIRAAAPTAAPAVARAATGTLGYSNGNDPTPRVNGCEACQIFSLNQNIYFVVLPYQVHGSEITLADDAHSWHLAADPGTQAFHVQIPGGLSGTPKLSWGL